MNQLYLNHLETDHLHYRIYQFQLRMNQKRASCLRIAFVVLLLALVLYRPIPKQLGGTTRDKINVHVIETLCRVGFLYPSYLCTSSQCVADLLRLSTIALNWIIGPTLAADSPILFMETTVWNGVRVYRPRENKTAESDGAIMFMHGGAFTFGDIQLYESLTRLMAEQMLPRLFVSIDYRRAPETPFPGALEDCERVLEYVIAQGPALYGVDVQKIILIGDSAGGNLVAAITQRRRAAGTEPNILGQVLIYPWLQMSDMQTSSYRNWHQEMSQLGFMSPRILAFATLWYAGVHAQSLEFVDSVMIMHNLQVTELFHNDSNIAFSRPSSEIAEYMEPFLTNPDFAPLMRKDLSGLPPAFVLTCEFDVLRDEGVAYVQRLMRTGVPTHWKHYEHGFHAMLSAHNRLDVAVEALSDIKEWTLNLLKDDKLKDSNVNAHTDSICATDIDL